MVRRQKRAQLSFPARLCVGDLDVIKLQAEEYQLCLAYACTWRFEHTLREMLLAEAMAAKRVTEAKA